jgi:hypothetical protein
MSLTISYLSIRDCVPHAMLPASAGLDFRRESGCIFCGSGGGRGWPERGAFLA